MKTKATVIVLGIVLLNICQVIAQTLQFTKTEVNDEGAIRFDWQSESNAIYRIDYTPEISDSITWETLYEAYPSHGTNTFFLDTGRYFDTPQVLHPKKDFMRYYRVVEIGANTTTAPTVAITSPTNSATLSGDVTISITTSNSLPFLQTLLFIDGEEVDASDDGTNFVINTCEWPNGNHVIFVVARATDNLEGPKNVTVNEAYTVSAYVSVTFDNLITKVAFSEPFFEPSLGQTQQVTAAFAANVDWTLQIVDQSSNAVRTVTGSGSTLSYNWNGTGDGDTNIPNGIYMYHISASTNGSPSGFSGGGGGSTNPPPSPSFSSLAGMESGVFEFLLPPLPPGLSYGQDENGYEITSVQVERPISLNASSSLFESFSLESYGSSLSLSGLTPLSQNTSAPKRPPTAPVKNTAGKVGVAYFTYPNGRSATVPNSGLPFPLNRVSIEGSTSTQIFPALKMPPKLVKNFLRAMTTGGWKTEFNKSDNKLDGIELKRDDLGIGGSNLFNSVNLGLFISHGVYGTTLDHTSAANQSLQTYFPLGGINPANSWIRLSEFKFGGDLRWMGFLACNALRSENYDSMNNKGVLPITEDLHLLLSGSTLLRITEDFGRRLGEFLVGGKLIEQKTVKEAWFAAGINSFLGIQEEIRFRVAGWESCHGDTVNAYTSRDEEDSITYDDRVVAPYTP